MTDIKRTQKENSAKSLGIHTKWGQNGTVLTCLMALKPPMQRMTIYTYAEN